LEKYRLHLEKLVEERTNELTIANEKLHDEINQRKMTEEELRDSAEFSFNLLQNSPNPIIVINSDKSIKFVNSALQKLTGYSSAELLGQKPPYPYWTEETVEKTNREFSESFGGKGAVRVEEYFKKKNGERFWVEVTATPIINNGKTKYYIGNFVDITERKYSEETIRIAYSELDQIFNATADGMCLIAKDFKMLRVNKTFCTLFGINKDEATGRKCSDIFMHPLCHTPDCPVSLMLEGDKEFYECDTEIQNKDGIKIPCIFTVVPFRNPDGELIGMVQTFRDITKRKQAEELLQESESKYSTLVENANDGVTIFQDGIIKFVNKATEKLFGYTVEELIGKPFLDPIMPEYRELATQRYQDHLLGEKVPSFLEVKIKCKDGTVKGVEVTTNLIQYNEKPAAMTITRDITERKRTEELLRDSEQKYSILLENAQDGVVIIQDGVYQFINKPGAKLTGYEIEEFIGMPFLNVVENEFKEASLQRYNAHLEGKEVPFVFVKNHTQRWHLKRY